MEQNGKLVITRQRKQRGEQVLSAFYENGKAVELSCFDTGEEQLLGSIYIGKVQNIVKNIEAAFIEIERGILCYYSLLKKEEPIYVKEKKGSKLSPGDELLVQVSREAVKTKVPSGAPAATLITPFSSTVILSESSLPSFIAKE